MRFSRRSLGFSIVVVSALVPALSPVQAELLVFPEKPVDPQLAVFAKAIRGIHEKAVRSRRVWVEADLRKQVPAKYAGLADRYGRVRDPKTRALALSQLALLYAELAWVERIGPLREAVERLDEKLAARLGHFEASEHFLVRVVGADPKWGKAALRLGEAAREGYLKLFGFPSISKVAGKKIRILIQVDPEIRATRLYFHPTPLYHSELRYEMPDAKFLTLSGRRRIVYGFCHELGHMVAMWGKYRAVEDDKHAWAHYTGSLVVEEVYEKLGNKPWPTWTAYQRKASGKARLLEQIAGEESGTESYESILALFYRIGEEFGTRVYGKAWEWLEKKKRFRRLNHVPYLWLRDLQEALLHVLPRENASRVEGIFGGR